MPFNVVFVHGIVGIAGEALRFKLGESRMVSRLEFAHFALGPLYDFWLKQYRVYGGSSSLHGRYLSINSRLLQSLVLLFQEAQHSYLHPPIGQRHRLF